MPKITESTRSFLLSFAVFVPLLLLAFFALRTLSLEQDALKARNVALMETRLDAMASTLTARLELSGRDELEIARDVWSNRGPEALRYFVLSGDVGFALVFRHGQRVFPPDESDQLLLHKQGGLSVFEGPARTLLENLDPSNQAAISRLLLLRDQAYTLLRCSRNSDNDEICIAIEPQKMSNLLRSALNQAVGDEGQQGESIWLVTPENKRVGTHAIEPDAPTISRALGGQLHGWRIETIDGLSTPSPTSESVAIFILAGVLIAGCALLSLGLYRASIEKANSAEQRARVIAFLSHELRTPLANLRLYVDLLKRQSHDPKTVMRYADVVDEEISRLEQIANNAIELSRGAGNVSQMEWGVPDEVVSRIVERFTPLMEQVRCDVDLTSDAATSCLYDRSAWERIIVNLLDNARKYAPGSKIRVTSLLRENQLMLRVEDDGPGIAADMQDQIFEPLSRDAKSNVPGFGLGLSVVRSLAWQHGGDVILEKSTNGSTFMVTMNVQQMPQPERHEA